MDRTWHRHGTDYPSADDGLHALWPCSSKQLSRRTTWSTSSQVKRAAGDPCARHPDGSFCPGRVTSDARSGSPTVCRRGGHGAHCQRGCRVSPAPLVARGAGHV